MQTHKNFVFQLRVLTLLTSLHDIEVDDGEAFKIPDCEPKGHSNFLSIPLLSFSSLPSLLTKKFFFVCSYLFLSFYFFPHPLFLFVQASPSKSRRDTHNDTHREEDCNNAVKCTK